jgi:plasmid stabilization system protein ParE
MEEGFRISILAEASSDLTAIFAYIENRSPQNARAVVAKLIDSIDSLARFPHRYKVHFSSLNRNRIVHSMPVPPFIIYYRVIEVHRVVEAMTIRHGARRQPRRFK